VFLGTEIAVVFPTDDRPVGGRAPALTNSTSADRSVSGDDPPATSGAGYGTGARWSHADVHAHSHRRAGHASPAASVSIA